jgi:periplasmic copper chaperone A
MNTALRIRALAALALGLALPSLAPAEVKASGGWARATPPGAKTAAGYLAFTNSGDEERRLLKIVSPVSDDVSLHRSSIDEKGMTRMWPMAVLAVQPGETLRLEPGGIHVMFGALKTQLVAGQKVPLTIKFDGGEPEFTVQLEVVPLTATSGPAPR